MIEIKQAEGKYWVSSVDLYDLFGRERDKYYRWVRQNILNNCSIEDKTDYFLFREARNGRRIPSRTEYYLSVPITIGFCISEGTITSKNIRKFIQKDMKERVIKNYIKR